MRARILAAVAATVALSLSGCGTVCNLVGGVTNSEEEPRVYGGVQRDVEVLSDVFSDTSHPDVNNLHGDGKEAAFLAAIFATLFAGDPVLSFVGDTLTLPVTIPLQNKRIAEKEQESAAATAAPPPDLPAEQPPQVERLPAPP